MIVLFLLSILILAVTFLDFSRINLNPSLDALLYVTEEGDRVTVHVPNETKNSKAVKTTKLKSSKLTDKSPALSETGSTLESSNVATLIKSPAREAQASAQSNTKQPSQEEVLEKLNQIFNGGGSNG